MTLKSIIDPKKRAKVREALRKGDPSMLKSEKRSQKAKPTRRNDLSHLEQIEVDGMLFQSFKLGDGIIACNLDLAKEALEKGADPNTRDQDGNTPLALIAKGEGKLQLHMDPPKYRDEGGKCHEIAKLLISKGADINSRNTMNETPLILAAANFHLEFIEFLLDKDVDVNCRDSTGWTALGRLKNRAGSDRGISGLLSKHGATE